MWMSRKYQYHSCDSGYFILYWLLVPIRLMAAELFHDAFYIFWFVNDWIPGSIKTKWKVLSGVTIAAYKSPRLNRYLLPCEKQHPVLHPGKGECRLSRNFCYQRTGRAATPLMIISIAYRPMTESKSYQTAQTCRKYRSWILSLWGKFVLFGSIRQRSSVWLVIYSCIDSSSPSFSDKAADTIKKWWSLWLGTHTCVPGSSDLSHEAPSTWLVPSGCRWIAGIFSNY